MTVPTPPASPTQTRKKSPKRMLKKGRVLQEVFHELKEDVVIGTGAVIKATRSLSARNLFAKKEDSSSSSSQQPSSEEDHRQESKHDEGQE